MTEVELGFRAFVCLALIAAACGIGVSIIFRRWADRAAIQRSRNLIYAYLLEFRLFLDEPILILRAQRNLLLENFRLLRLLLRPALIVTVPMILVLGQLDAFYAHAALVCGEPAIVTLQLANGQADPLNTPSLAAPAGISVETPAVRVLNEHQVSWRVRPLTTSAGSFKIDWQNQFLTKSVACGPGVRYLSERRGNFWNFLLHPAELPLHTPGVKWIEVLYPRATILNLNWLVWFFVVSAIAMLLFTAAF
ncbi:MAG TPA: hypothetical protein VKV15_06450 [Bryobacteraceae bacterium]|nr:hypothetical protein [Bryobacteraceae bacterium]